MGTNFYLHYNCCPWCGKPRNIEHLGKASIGWRFLFHKTDDIQNFEDFKIMIDQGTIYDEYDRCWSSKELIDFINSKQNDEIDDGGENIDGYIFFDSDFS